MEFVNSIILGIIQGATEFLPISSSGHLIIVRDILGINLSHGLAFDAVLQLATTLAVLVYFAKDIWGYIKTFFKLIFSPFRHPREGGDLNGVSRKEKILLYAIIFGTIPSIIFGFFLEKFMEGLFRNSTLVAGALIVGAIIMWLAEKYHLSFLRKHESSDSTERSHIKLNPLFREDDNREGRLNPQKGFLIGLFQSLALFPGFSRSGMTISGGLFLGLNRAEAIKFSFLLAFPILFASGLKKLFDLGSSGLLESVGGPLLVGSIVSFIVGLIAIHFLITFLKKHTLNTFVLYRIFLAVIVLIFV